MDPNIILLVNHAHETLPHLLERAVNASENPVDPVTGNDDERALREAAHSNPFGLTARQYEVATYLAEGLSNKAIARKLDISVGTVKVHVKFVLRKLGLHSRADVAIERDRQCRQEH